MNDSPPDPTASPLPHAPSSDPAPDSSTPPRADRTLGYWLRRLLICNPFFLVSAALLLYAVARLSSDSSLFRDETRNLWFNFLALQCYSLLLVFTAIRLARRSIWYDSALLGVLEHGLVLVPFLLLSQAIFIAPKLGGVLIAWTGAAAVGRAWWIRGGYPLFHLPAGALRLGAGLLALNMAAPLVVYRIVDRTSVDDWAVPNRLIWTVLLPLLVFGANRLPRPSRYGGLNPERSWLPLCIYGLWVSGTGVHAWALGYVCKQPFSWALMIPSAWAITWTLYQRTADFVASPSLLLRAGWLSATFLVPLLSLDKPSIAAPLLGLNLVGYVLLALRGLPALRPVAHELAIASLTTLAVLVPAGWLQPMLTALHLTQTHWILTALGLYAMRCCWRLPFPTVGLGSAIALGIGIAISAPVDFSGTLGLQGALAWLLVHSLRWEDARGADASSGRGLRHIAAMGWVAHAALSARDGTWQQGASITILAAMVLVAWWIVAWPKRSRQLAFIPFVALIPLVAAPADWLISRSPAGLLALVMSFVLFGCGTAAAYLRHHWDHTKRSPR